MAEVVTQQPAGLGGPTQQVLPGCPIGLEHLAVAETVFIKQEVEMLEILTGYETANHYTILNEKGQQIYFAAEESDCLTRTCCGANRAFDIKIVDNERREVLRFMRPFRCCGCCCSPCCLQRLEASRGEELVGLLTEDVSLCAISFSVRSPYGETQLKVVRGCCKSACCGDIEFRIKSADGRHDVGRLAKQWGGFVHEALTDSDSFYVSFPRDMDIGTKATVLGAVFLIDFMYFENT